jgi:hypothetical protein
MIVGSVLRTNPFYFANNLQRVSRHTYSGVFRAPFVDESRQFRFELFHATRRVVVLNVSNVLNIKWDVFRRLRRN